MPLVSVTTLTPEQAPASPGRLYHQAAAAGFDVTVTEAREGGKKAWGVVGTHPTTGRRFEAYWSQTEAGGCKAVGQLVNDGEGSRAVKSRELTSWIGAA
jgi:hypothetical protein